MQRKYEQIKNYAKILKEKRGTGQIEEVNEEDKQLVQEEQIIEEDNNKVDMLKNQQFQDQFEDQYEEEEVWESQSEEEAEEEEEANQSGTMMSEVKQKDIKKEEEEGHSKSTVYLGSNKHLNKGEVLQFDNKAYDMLHRLNVEWPSMSIDFIIKSSPFDSSPSKYQQMNKYPYEIFTVQGSCNNTNKNSVYFTKWAKLHQTKYDDDPDGNDQNDQNNDQDPQIIIQQIQTNFDINRLRSLNNSPIVAFWNDDGFNRGQIRILDLCSNLQKLNNNIGTKKKDKCKEIIIPCDVSGYAINWNPNKIGQLVAGDNNGVIRVYNNNQNYTKWSKTSEYTYHKASVEDIMFSPEQSHVFASCSADGTLQVVDMRTNNYKKSQLKINAHMKDVNVFDWNKTAAHLIVTGSDDCKVKVWDLRMVSQNSDDELLCFNWHTQPITSIKFQPNEESVIAVSSEDNRLTIWDMSVQNQDQADNDIPNEMMFLHQGQEEIKEISYHPIYYEMLISTSLDSINIFKPAFEMPEYCQDEKIDRQDLKRPPIRQEDLDKYLERMSLE